MNKNKRLILTFVLSAIFLASCSNLKPPTPATPAEKVDYQEACSPANQGKTVMIEGFLNVTDKTPCSIADADFNKSSCGFKLMDKVNVVGHETLLYLIEGNQSNQAETPNVAQKIKDYKLIRIYARNEIRIHLEDGTIYAPEENVALPVTVTGAGKISEATTNHNCVMQISKIEKR